MKIAVWKKWKTLFFSTLFLAGNIFPVFIYASAPQNGKKPKEAEKNTKQSASLPAVKKTLPPAKKPSAKRSIVISPEEQKFFRELALIFDSIRKSSPQTGKKLDEQLKRDSLSVIRDLLQTRKLGIVTLTVTPGRKKVVLKKKPLQKQKIFFTEELSGNKILYIFLPDLSLKNFEMSEKALKKRSASVKGVIVDLRLCDDYKSPYTEKFLRLFSDLSGKKSHTAILTGNGTKGFGEILAWQLKNSPTILSVGTPTRGQPFILRRAPVTMRQAVPDKKQPGKLKITRVMHILVPVIPEQWKNVPAAKVIPKVRTKSQNIYALERKSPAKDPALQAASDLLLSLDVIGSKNL